jgi:hypothetical protein
MRKLTNSGKSLPAHASGSLGVPAEVREDRRHEASRSTIRKNLRKEAWDEKSTRVFVLCGIELNRAKQILATVREMARRNKTHLSKTMKTNPLFKFLGIATIGAAVAGTAVAGPSGGYTFRSLLGFGAGCPMRTPETKLAFVSTPKNMGISQIVTGYRYKGCIGKSEKTMMCPGSNLTCLQMIRS